MPVAETTILLGCLKTVGGCIPACIPQEWRDRLARPVSYVLCYSCNVKNLKDKINDLRKAEVEVEIQIQYAETNQRITKDKVQEWHEKTKILLGKFYAIIERKLDNPEGSSCCCESACEIGEMTDDIEELLKQSQGFQIVAYRGDPLPVSSLYNTDNMSVLSRERIVEKILEALKSGHNNKITICGLPGAGKTTMLKNTVIHPEVGKLFDVMTHVIDSISETPDIKMIQNSVANRIGLVFSKRDGELGRSATLREQLKSKLHKGKRILVVLDDLMDPDDIKGICKKVGIPFSPSPQAGLSCTILMSSRNCTSNKNMSSREVHGSSCHFRLGCLHESEAESLFRVGLLKRIRNEEEYGSPQYTSMENYVLQRCQGLPSAITELSHVIKQRWGDRNEIVKQLKHRNLCEVDHVDQRSHKSVLRSYNLLKIEGKKNLFLLISCLLRPGASIAIGDFMRYSIGLSLFGTMKTLKDCTGTFDRWVEDMKSLSLFENKDGQDCISIHNIIQESAISIASKEEYLLQEEGPLYICPNYDKYTIISASVLSLKRLVGIKLPKLKALLLKERSSLATDGEDNYFTWMKKLKVLGFSEIRLSRLPSSIKHLQNLATLSVENCDIELDASLISELPLVTVLSLRGSKIKVFPKDNMGGVILLDLTDCCFEEEVVGDVVANSYHSLAGLYMCGCRFAGKPTIEVVTETLVGRLRSIEYALEIEIPSACLPIYDGNLLSVELKMFKIAIGCKVPSSFKEFYLYKQVMLLEEIDAALFLWGSLLCLLEKTECLRLVRIGKLDKVIFNLNVKLEKLKWLQISHCGGMNCVVTTAGFLQLEGVEVRDCADLEHISSTDGSGGEVAAGFPCLKKLELQSLPKLKGLTRINGDQTHTDRHQLFHEKINLTALEELILSNLDNIQELWSQGIREGSQNKLHKMNIFECANLKSICPPTVAAALVELESLEITSCGKLEEVIMKETNANPTVIKFSSVQRLKLKTLPSLRCFFQGSHTVEFPSLKTLILSSLPMMSTFHITPTNAAFGHTSTTNRTLFGKIVFPSLEDLKLKNMCGGIEKLVKEGHEDGAFPELKNLALENVGIRFVATAMLSKLQQLKLQNCGSLTDLHWASLLYLRSLVIRGGLPGMRYMLSCGDIVQGNGLPRLQDMEIEGCEQLQEIVSNTVHADSSRSPYGTTMFPQLKHIKLRKLPEFRTFSSGSYEAAFPALEKVEIYTCQKLESFSLGELHTPNLQSVQVDGQKSTQRDINLNDFLQINRNPVEDEAPRDFGRAPGEVDDNPMNRNPGVLRKILGLGWSPFKFLLPAPVPAMNVQPPNDIRQEPSMTAAEEDEEPRDFGKAPVEIDRKGKGKAKADGYKHNDAKPYVFPRYKGVKIQEPQNPTELTAVPTKNQQDDEAPRAPVEIDRKGKGKAEVDGYKENDAKAHVFATNKETPGPQDVPARVEEGSGSSVGDLVIGRNGALTAERADHERLPGRLLNCSEEQQMQHSTESTMQGISNMVTGSL